jgi:uncharacterized protein YutE (UPF0331/DUF86 family)
MSLIDTQYLQHHIRTLEKAHELLQKHTEDTIEFHMYRSACIKEFEIIVEQSGKLLRKCLLPYFANSKSVDQLFYKDVFKQCVLRSILTTDLCERFLEYRDSRNLTAHDYGSNLANELLEILPNFITDAWQIIAAIENYNDAITSKR